MTFIWRLEEVAIGIEDTRGQKSTKFIKIPKTEMDFDDKVEKIEDTSWNWSIVDSVWSYISKAWAEWNIWMNLWTESFWVFLKTLLGKVKTTDSLDLKKHEFTILNSNTHPTLSIMQKNPLGQLLFLNWVIDSLTISWESGSLITLTSTLKSKPSESDNSSLWETLNDSKLLWKQISFRLWNTIAWAKNSLPIDIKSFELNIEKNIVEDFALWDVAPKDFFNQNLRISWSLTATFKNKDLRDLGLSEDSKSLYLSIQDTKTSKSLDVELPLVTFENWNLSRGNDEIATQDIEFVSRSPDVKFILTNNTNEY